MGEFRYVGLGVLTSKAIGAQVQATEQVAEDFTGKAMEAETAVESGTLKGGIHVESVTVTGNSVTAIVATGAESSDYAIYIHEGHRADGSHTIAAYPGGLKYMERPLVEQAAVYREHLARATRAEF